MRSDADHSQACTKLSIWAWMLAWVVRTPLGLLVVPLVFASLVTGVAGIGDLRRLGRVGVRSFALSLVLSAASVAASDPSAPAYESEIVAVAATLLLASCGSSEQPQNLTGAGATFPYPIYSKWFSEYQKAHPLVQINYQSQGSGAGIRQVTEGTVDFGASDQPMTDEQLNQLWRAITRTAKPGARVLFRTAAAPTLLSEPATEKERELKRVMLRDFLK